MIGYRRFRYWLRGVRHGAVYRAALEHMLSQGSAMSRPDAGVWALELASNTLQDHNPHTNSATPKLREVFTEFLEWEKAGKND